MISYKKNKSKKLPNFGSFLKFLLNYTSIKDISPIFALIIHFVGVSISLKLNVVFQSRHH
jgi:hypothetical protein